MYDIVLKDSFTLCWLRIKVFVHFNVVEKIRYQTKSDRQYNIALFKKSKGKEPDLSSPKTFSEKLLYLKMYYRNPLMTLCSDKYYVREYVKACGYESILKKVYYVGKDARSIPYDELPDKFFIRCNHMSGFNYILSKRDIKDPKALGAFFNVILKNNWYYHGREWNYKNISSRIMCEEYLENSDGSDLVDYKFYCFDGKPVYYMVSCGELNHQVRNHKFDMNDKSIDYHFKAKPTLEEDEVTLPENIEEMKTIAKALCKPFPHVRVDLYNIDGRIVFGELTFFSNGGVVNMTDEAFERHLGSLIDLDKYRFDMA